MFFAKKIKGATAQKQTVNLNLNFNKTKGEFLNCRNVQRVGNSLLSTFGFIQTFQGLSITKAVYQHGDYNIILTREYGLFAFNGRRPYRVIVPTDADGIVGYVEYQGKNVFSCDMGTFYSNNGFSPMPICDDYYPSLAKCYDRVFGVNGTKLSMTAAGDITQWDDSMTITSHTNLDAVVALDKLYALGDTCYSLTPDAEEKNMKFVPFGYGVGTVQVESVATLGKSAIFASTNGLYQLKSTALTPIFTQLYDYVSFDGSVACVHNGKYYIACKRKDGEMTRNDILLALDIDSGEICSVFDVEAQHINVLNGRLYMASGDSMYFEYDEDIESSFCQTVDFASSNVKYLDKLTVRAQSDMDIWIDNGREKRRYRIKGKNAIQSVPLTGSGRQFTVEAQAPKGFHLDLLQLSAHTYEV